MSRHARSAEHDVTMHPYRQRSGDAGTEGCRDRGMQGRRAGLWLAGLGRGELDNLCLQWFRGRNSQASGGSSKLESTTVLKTNTIKQALLYNCPV